MATEPAVLSVNVGAPAVLREGRAPTGIGKVPVDAIDVADPGRKRRGPSGEGLSGVAGDFIGSGRHHGGSDQAVYAFAREQLAAFLPWARALQARHPRLILHAANSAATLGIPESRLDLVRCGIATYGMDPFGVSPDAYELEPALEPARRRGCFSARLVKPSERIHRGRRYFDRRRLLPSAERSLGVAQIALGNGSDPRPENGSTRIIAIRLNPRRLLGEQISERRLPTLRFENCTELGDRLVVYVGAEDELDQVLQRQDVRHELEHPRELLRGAEGTGEERHRQDDDVHHRGDRFRGADQRRHRLRERTEPG